MTKIGISIGRAIIDVNTEFNELPQDGQRMVKYLESLAWDNLTTDAVKATKKFAIDFFQQIIDFVECNGYWPVVRSVVWLPRMAQNEEKFPSLLREEIVANDISIMENAKAFIEKCIESRPDSAYDYFNGGIDGHLGPLT
jgi:hypothetical protein